MNIGIFSGSFNPIHIGHLALANYLCEYGDLDEVWFMVTPHNPLKEENELMDDKLRLKLVQLATEGYPKFRASDSAWAFLYSSYVGCAETNLSSTHFPSCHWFGQLEAVPPLVRVGTYSCRKSSSGLSSPRLSGRGRLFTSKCADSFFSDI